MPEAFLAVLHSWKHRDVLQRCAIDGGWEKGLKGLSLGEETVGCGLPLAERLYVMISTGQIKAAKGVLLRFGFQGLLCSAWAAFDTDSYESRMTPHAVSECLLTRRTKSQKRAVVCVRPCHMPAVNVPSAAQGNNATKAGKHEAEQAGPRSAFKIR